MMQRATKIATVALTVMAMIVPLIDASAKSDRNKDAQQPPRNVWDAVNASVERDQRNWMRLSSSICTGCITSANRVAMVSYEKPGQVAPGSNLPSSAKTALRKSVLKTRLSYKRKHYARLHSRQRIRLAARIKRLRLARALKAKKMASVNMLPLVMPIGWSSHTDLKLSTPVNLPNIPLKKDAQRDIILSTQEIRPRRS